MEAGGAGIGRLDCYEDMFKEITRKLYGEDPDHRTSSVQNEFETSVSYNNDEDTGNGTDGSDDGKWTLDEEPLIGTEGSRIAAYRAATSTWRCYECGDCMGGGPRDMAEHFVELHSSRIACEESARGRLHSNRKDYMSPGDLKLEDVVSYLERVRDRAERSAPPTRRTQETQTVPAALLPVPSTFLLQELPSTPPQHLHQQQSAAAAPMPATSTPTVSSAPGANGGTAGGGSSASAGAGGGGGGGGGGNNASGKRYTCLYCPYGTDRRDLYTRHENIHREEKPFHCYVCYKPFSRADHVKKHFLRMHREHTYELSRIRRPMGAGSAVPKAPVSVQPSESSSIAATTTGNIGSPYSASSIYSNPKLQMQQQTQPPSSTYQLQSPTSASAALYQAASLSSAVAAAAAAAAAANASNIMQQQPDANCGAATPVSAAQAARRLQNGGCGSKGNIKTSGSGSSKGNQERRYTCCYCSWSGVDNWCLKRHLNTHLKPFACALCEYKAARAERLATHVLKVHNRRQCSRCSFLAEDLTQLQVHQLHVHRVSSAGVAAAAAAAAQSSQQSGQSDRQQPQQPQPIHPVGGGRPPPGPPVFPASSAAIAPATTVIPPTTILGERSEVASMPGTACWEQETSSCEERFNQSGERRSRKQRMPRKIPVALEAAPQDLSTKARQPSNPQQQQQQQQQQRQRRELVQRSRRPNTVRCFLCPRGATARARFYHSRPSLLLHKLWRHRCRRLFRDPTAITIRATVFTGRDFDYQR